MEQLAIAAPKQSTFLSWNLTVARPSSTLALISSALAIVTGNLPHFAKNEPPSLP
jgi:hypothetical protein